MEAFAVIGATWVVLFAVGFVGLVGWTAFRVRDLARELDGRIRGLAHELDKRIRAVDGRAIGANNLALALQNRIRQLEDNAKTEE